MKRFFQTIVDNEKVNYAIRFLLAVCVVLSLHARLYLIDNFGQECFSNLGLIDFVCLAGVIYLFKQVRKCNSKVECGSIILSAILTFLYLLSSSFFTYNSWAIFTGGAKQKLFVAICFVGISTLVTCFITLIIECVKEHAFISENVEITKEDKNRFQLMVFITIVLGWLFWIVLDYPGSVSMDAYYQIRQFMGVDNWYAEQPLLSTLLFGVFFKIGVLVGNANLGLFLYLFAVVIFGGYVFSKMIVLLYELGVKKSVCILMMSFFAFLPMWGCFANWVEKDLLYSEVVALFVINLYEVIRRKDSSVSGTVGIIITALLVSLLRLNGFYVVVPTLLCLCLIKTMNNRKRVIISFLVVIALYEGTVNLLYPMCGMGKSTMRGAMWIPFQQTARYVQNYSDEITDEERESINSVLDIDVIGEAYNPIVGDPVMNTYKWDDSKLPSYLITWGKMFFKHPGVYFAAAINQEYGYYAPIETNIEPKIEGDQFSELFVYLYEVGVRRTASDKSIELLRNLRDFNTNIPILKHLVEPGFYTWLMIIASFILLKFKKKAEFIILVPGYMTLFVCLISPLHNAIRYELPVAAIAPFFVGIALLANKKE